MQVGDRQLPSQCAFSTLSTAAYQIGVYCFWFVLWKIHWKHLTAPFFLIASSSDYLAASRPPPHDNLDVRAFMNAFMEWIERRGSMVFGLNSVNFSLCSLLKDKVFSVRPRSLEHSKELIVGHIDALFIDKYARICKTVLKRC